MSDKVKVSINDTTSEQLTAASKDKITVTDATGRKITLRKPNILSQYRLVKILGEAASNKAYMAMVTPITYVVEIDGEEIFQPNTERELDALIQRLDEAGIFAVMEGLAVHFTPEESKDQQGASLKNS